MAGVGGRPRRTRFEQPPKEARLFNALEWRHCEQVLNARESGAIAVLAEGADLVGLEQIEGEAAQAGEHARVGADARAILAQGDVTRVVGRGLDLPVCADGRGGPLGRDGGVRDIERGFGRMAQQTGSGAAGEHVALDADHGGGMGLPVGPGEGAGGSKTLTRRRSSRLRPVSWLWTEPRGGVVAQTSRARSCSVGWLSLTWTIRVSLACEATSNPFFGSARHQG